MPVVYVHGVATRTGPDYDRAVAARAALTRACMAGPLLRGAGPLAVVDCYWGDLGAGFSRSHATLPTAFASTEAFGEVSSTGPLARVDGTEEGPRLGGDAYRRAPLLATARQSSLSEAVDLLWEATEGHLREEEAAPTADLVVRAAVYASHHPRPEWLHAVMDDSELVIALADVLSGEPPSHGSAQPELETFGPKASGHAAPGRLREGAARLAGTLPRVGSTLLLSGVRRPVHRGVSLFLGDVLVYVQQLGRNGAPGPIAQRVALALEEGHRLRTEADPHLMVVAHSLGGSICLDLFTRPGPAPRWKIDTFVTVGSQVGLLAELGLFPHVPQPPGAAPRPVPAPDGIGRWLNVYDIDDSLSFLAAPVFDGVEDLRYSTGRSLLHAHSSYLSRPSFFLRLADRLGKGRS